MTLIEMLRANGSWEADAAVAAIRVRDMRIEKLEAALRVIVQVWDTDQPISIARAALARDAAREALEGKDD